MATTTSQLTVEEFQKLPEDSGSAYHELRHGVIVAVTRSKLKHHLIQARLRDLLEAMGREGSFVEYGMAFRALPEYELWVAGVAYLSAERFKQADPEDNIHGAPDLVVEVLSPSNTAVEIYDKERLCLANGAQQFWVVDADRRQVKVSTPDGCTVTYRAARRFHWICSRAI
jgi:Uma2 family endonuclease